MISKQKDARIINITQLRKIRQTELNTYLNFKRGKYRFKSLIDMTSNLPLWSKKPTVASPETRVSVISPQTFDSLGDKTTKNNIIMSKVQSKHHMEIISKWGEQGVDILGFAEIFADDIPFISRDIFFHCTLVEIPGCEHRFNAYEVFDHYKLSDGNQSVGTDSTFYNTSYTKGLRTTVSVMPRMPSNQDSKPTDSENSN